ncbi:hypothetical protein HMPREF1544_02934 [Mucor circinelloides 1006PhL]|uniref:Uncharacterized protein n=1 Tax=Mucor circinelloides f. circinelloides (strain 1006PhL) TaxID=1220926 RepID=S2K4H2_MUCC1|nr:hypothetical protein HMPREF1544_02934 [Mucor circinelloides 1006PhL]
MTTLMKATILIKLGKAGSTDGDTVEVDNVAENANDNAGEVDDTGDTVANCATDCIRSQLMSKAKLFSDKEEIYKLLMSGCIHMMNAVQRSEYKHLLNESHYDNIIQQCCQIKQLEPIPTEIDLIINEIFDDLLPFRFDRNTNQAISTIDTMKAAVQDKKSTRYAILDIVSQM